MRRRRPRVGGFTLIEVMLAVVIVAIMSALIWASFGRTLRVTKQLDTDTEWWQGVRVAMDRITREVSSAFISSDYDTTRYPDDDPANRPTFFLIDDQGDQDRLAFTGFVNRRLFLDEKSSDQAIVDYTVGTDDDGHTDLFRRQKSVIDGEWQRGGDKEVLLENVTAFNVQWWNPDDKSWQDGWDTHDSDQHDRIPSRIRITIKCTDPDGHDHTFVTESRVKLTQPLSW